MWAANILGGTITLLLGIVIRAFNASGLIAGYNTASAAERAKYDEKALTRFMGNLLIAASPALPGGCCPSLSPHRGSCLWRSSSGSSST